MTFVEDQDNTRIIKNDQIAYIDSKTYKFYLCNKRTS